MTNLAPIKIVRIISRLNIGGPAHNVKILSEYLPKNYKTILISGTPSETEGDMSYILKETPNYQHVIVPELGRSIHFFHEIIAFLKIFKILYTEKPDFVCTHASKAGFLGRLAAFILRVPIVLHTFHGHVFHGYFSPWLTTLIIHVERFLAKGSTAIIAISERQKRELVDVYQIAPSHKVHVARLGFELNQFLPMSRRVQPSHFRLPKDKFLIGIVGRLVPIKNHAYFFEVALEVLKQRQDVHFVIVGDGELRDKLVLEATWRGIQNSISFLGWQKNLSEIYDLLDLVVLTSKNEGTPVSLIEAQACGKPVIATRVGGVEDIVFHGKNGYLVDLANPEQFAEHIVTLLLDKQMRHSMGKWGRDFVFKHYTKDTLIQNMDQLYRSYYSVV